MNNILRINSSIVFLILTIPWAFKYFYPFTNYDWYMICSLIAYTLIFLWFLMLDSELTKRIPPKLRPSNTWFLINLFVLWLWICIAHIFFGPGHEFRVTGFAALPFLIPAFYFLFTMVSTYNHLSKLLTYAEEQQEVGLSNRIGEMVLFFFFFIGLWWLQPRIKKVLEKSEIVAEKYKSFRK